MSVESEISFNVELDLDDHVSKIELDPANADDVEWLSIDCLCIDVRWWRIHGDPLHEGGRGDGD